MGKTYRYNAELEEYRDEKMGRRDEDELVDENELIAMQEWGNREED